MIVKKYDIGNIEGKDIKSIRGALESINGVHAVRVDNVANTVTVEFENGVDESQITSKLRSF